MYIIRDSLFEASSERSVPTWPLKAAELLALCVNVEHSHSLFIGTNVAFITQFTSNEIRVL